MRAPELLHNVWADTEARPCGRFVGFTDVPEMPTPRSDMTVTSYNTMEADNTRLYIIGGCVSLKCACALRLTTVQYLSDTCVCVTLCVSVSECVSV